MSNLDLWSALETTPSSAVKNFNRRGFRGTAINAAYIIKRLTEQFGPNGVGWRFVLEDEKFVAGHTLNEQGDHHVVHIVRGHLEYRIDENTWASTSPQFGQTDFVYVDKNGVHTDEEAPKKSVTDCVAKCALLLGVGGDVHLKKYDDNKYVAERRAEEAATGSSPLKGCGQWHGAQWSEYLTKHVADTPALHKLFGQICQADPKQMPSKETGEWEHICGAFSGRLAELDDFDSYDKRDDLISLFTQQREAIDHASANSES